MNLRQKFLIIVSIFLFCYELYRIKKRKEYKKFILEIGKEVFAEILGFVHIDENGNETEEKRMILKFKDTNEIEHIVLNPKTYAYLDSTYKESQIVKLRYVELTKGIEAINEISSNINDDNNLVKIYNSKYNKIIKTINILDLESNYEIVILDEPADIVEYFIIAMLVLIFIVIMLVSIV